MNIMASRVLTRPSSARRKIQQETFSTHVSSTRLRRVQGLLREKGIDALLAILGIDGRYNEGTLELVNYLLFGLFESRRAELESSGYEGEVIDDMIFVVRKSSVDVYCNAINYFYLLPYIAHWHNLHFHCLKDENYDQEKTEDFKIKSFIRMFDSSQCIGIPFYNCAQDGGQFDPMLLERWPIVQAFALEGFGGGGFFTMKHKLVDVSERLHQLYQFFDPVAMEILVSDQLPQFEQQWTAMYCIIDTHRRLNTMAELTEGSVSEPLRTYFIHGRVGMATKSMPCSRQPLVLFGVNTNRAVLQGALKPRAGTQCTVSDKHMDGALHMVCQAVSPRSAITCVRTYFLLSGSLPHPVTSHNNNETAPVKHNTVQVVPSGVNTWSCGIINLFGFNKCIVGVQLTQSEKYAADVINVRLLMQVYEACVHAVLHSIAVYTQTLSAKKAEDEARKKLQELCRQKNVPIDLAHLSNTKYVEFRLDAIDSYGSVVPLTEGERILLVKVVSLTVYDIASTQSKSKCLGSVCFAESFLDSTIQVIQPDDKKELSGESVIHTRHVPYFLSWPAGEVEHAAYMTVEKQLKTGPTNVLGQCLCSAECLGLVSLASPSQMVTDGQLYMCESGLAYLHPHQGAIVLPKTELTAIQVYDGESMDAVALLILSFKQQLNEFLPHQLHSPNNTLVLAFQPRTRAYKALFKEDCTDVNGSRLTALPHTKAYKALFKEVLPKWRKAEDPEVTSLATLPQELLPVHLHLQETYALSSATIPFGSAFNFRKAHVNLPELSRFMEHFAASSVGDAPVPSRDLACVIGGSEDQGGFVDEDEMIISVLGGLPGSHKENLATCLMRLSRDESRWAVMHHSLEERQEFSAEKLHDKLSAVWQARHKHRHGTRAKKPRALLVTPGFTGTMCIVRAIVNHPDPDIAKHLKIGAVTVCVDEANSFMSDMYTLPNLLDQCAVGLVNNILLTGSETSQDKDRVHDLLRSVNCDVAFLIAEKGEVSRSTDIDMILSESAFNDVKMSRARFLTNPGWWQGTYPNTTITPTMDEVILTFSRPLDKKRLLNRLISANRTEQKHKVASDIYLTCTNKPTHMMDRALKQMHRQYPYAGNVYHLRAKLRFSGYNQDEAAHVYEVTHTVLSGETTVSQARHQPAPPGQTAVTAGQTDSCCAAFIGCRLDKDHLKEWLRQCTVQLPERKVHRTRQSMTNTETNRIHKEHHLDPLPEGWFYNGHQFVSFDGEKSATHPNLQQFLQEYLDEINLEVAIHNARIDAMTHHDLFD